MPHQLTSPFDEALAAEAERRRGSAAAARKRLGRAITRHGRTAPWLRLLRYKLDRETGKTGAIQDVDLAFRADWTCAWVLGLGSPPSSPAAAAVLASAARIFAASSALAPVLAYRGQALLARGKREEGMEDLRRAAALEPAGWIVAWLGEAERKAGRLDAAMTRFDDALRRDPKYANAYAWRATARLQTGDLEGAEADLDRALKLQPTARAFMDRGRLRRRRGDWAGALADQRAAVLLNPDLGWDGATARPDVRAVRELDEAAARHPDQPWLQAWRGRSLLDLGRPADALAALAPVPKRKGMAWAAAWRAEALLELGRPDEARKEAARSIKDDPRYAPSRRLLAELHAREGRHAAAVAELSRAAKLYPYSARLYAMRARAELGRGRLAAARADVERALLLSPGYAEAAALREELRGRPKAPVFSLKAGAERPRALEFFVNYACNAHCAFCFNPPDATAALLRGLPFKELARRLYAGYGEGYRAVKFIGGEATLRPDLPKLVRLARLIGYQSVQLTTNGIKLGNPKYAELLWKAGVERFRFSIHGHTPELHDGLVEHEGALRHIERAVARLKALGAEIGVNYVLNQKNFAEFPETCEWIFGRLGLTDMIVYLMRHQGYGALPENRERLKLTMRQAAGPVRAAFAALKARGSQAYPALIHFAPCAMPELGGHMLDWRRDPADRDRVTLPDGAGGRIDDVTNSGKRPIPACGQCAHKAVCYGIETNYLDAFGDAEFSPVPTAEAELA